MTQDQSARERRYQAAMSVVRALIQNGSINHDDAAKLEMVFAGRYKPLISPILNVKDVTLTEEEIPK